MSAALSWRKTMTYRYEVPEQEYELSEPVEVCSIEQKNRVNRNYKLVAIVGNKIEADIWIKRMIKNNKELRADDYRVKPWKVYNPVILGD
jgi:hypothetical protein